MNLGDLRAAVADALAGIADVSVDDWTVHPEPVDAIEPPAFMLLWGPDPWRYTDTTCTDTAQLEVVCVAHRLEPEANYVVLEEMVDSAIAALTQARLRPYQTLAPGPFEIAQITYLAARLQIRRPVTIGGT
jgi:hypothetical protein